MLSVTDVRTPSLTFSNVTLPPAPQCCKKTFWPPTTLQGGLVVEVTPPNTFSPSAVTGPIISARVENSYTASANALRKLVEAAGSNSKNIYELNADFTRFDKLVPEVILINRGGIAANNGIDFVRLFTRWIATGARPGFATVTEGFRPVDVFELL